MTEYNILNKYNAMLTVVSEALLSNSVRVYGTQEVA